MISACAKILEDTFPLGYGMGMAEDANPRLKSRARVRSAKASGGEKNPARGSQEACGEKGIGLEEAASLWEINHLEHLNWQLWVVTMLIILVLTASMLFHYLEELGGLPGDLFQALQFPQARVLACAAIIGVFCLYSFLRNRVLRRQQREIFASRFRLERMAGALQEVATFHRISSEINMHKGLGAVLELIARESLSCLKGHRCTILTAGGTSGALKPYFSCASDPLFDQVGLPEEKEIGKRALKGKKALLCKERKEVALLLNYKERECKVSSIMMVPLHSQGQPVGALGLMLIDTDRRFDERSLQYLSVLANYASIALENASLTEEVRKGAHLRQGYEVFLEDILNQLQDSSEEERRRIQEHLAKLLPPSGENGESGPGPEEAGAREATKTAGKAVHEAPKIPRVDFAEMSLELSDDLGDGGVFIRTSNPLDLGEEFLLKLHTNNGDEPIETPCKVVWTNRYGKESRHLHRGMGVKFLRLEGQNRRRIKSYLERKRAESE